MHSSAFLGLFPLYNPSTQEIDTCTVASMSVQYVHSYCHCITEPGTVELAVHNFKPVVIWKIIIIIPSCIVIVYSCIFSLEPKLCIFT